MDFYHQVGGGVGQKNWISDKYCVAPELRSFGNMGGLKNIPLYSGV